MHQAPEMERIEMTEEWYQFFEQFPHHSSNNGRALVLLKKKTKLR
jgi:hypothetical protein